MSYTGLVDLKSCPCCNSGAHLTPMNTGHTVRFYVHCEHCGLRTPHYAVETEAIAAWNTRPDAIEALTRPVDVEAVAKAIAPLVCKPVHNGDCDDVTAGQDFARSLAERIVAALAAMEAPHADG